MNQPPQPNENSVSRWIAAARSGNADAVQSLFNRYFERLADLSRHRVQRKRRVEDEEDAALQTLQDFFAGIADGKYPAVTDRQSLWPLLTDIVIKRSLQQRRKQNSAKRNDAIVRGESIFSNNMTDGDGQWRNLAELAISHLNEQTTREMADIIETFRNDLDETDREIFDLKLSLKSNRQIAETLGRPSRTIDRKLSNSILPRLKAIFLTDF